MEKAVTLLSGGMDSLTCVAIAHNKGYNTYLLHINYGQRTEGRELNAFLNIADFYTIPKAKRLVVDVTSLKQIGGSSLTDPNMPVTEPDLENKEVPSSYVPFRNAHILAAAVSWSEVIGASKIYVGANELDASGYPDCRPGYYEAFNKLIVEGTKPETDIKVVTPVIRMRKSEIIKKAVELNAPLSLSWSCYKNNGDIACGNCDSCLLRLRGFYEAEIRDPIRYEGDSVRTRF